MEQQNDERLDALYSKISQIKNVTIDIHSDSRSQNQLLDRTGETFDSFKTQLSNSAGRLGRSIQNGQGQTRVLMWTVVSVVGLFFLWKWFG